jgi:hypothetical protein
MMEGDIPSLKEKLMISVIGPTSKSAFSLISQDGMPSGPEIFLGLSERSLVKTELKETAYGTAGGSFG